MKMGRYNVLIQPSALIDIQQARTYYRNISVSLVKKLNAELDSSVSLIAKAPFAYGIRFDNNRRYNLKHFPFSIYYLADEEAQAIHLTAFVHTSRNYPNQSENPTVLHEP